MITEGLQVGKDPHPTDCKLFGPAPASTEPGVSDSAGLYAGDLVWTVHSVLQL